MRSTRLLLLSMLLSAPALADETRHALVVPTQLGGFIPNKMQVQQGIDVLIGNRLRRAKVDVTDNPPFLPEEITCHDDVCLAQIANRHGVEVVVSSRLVNDEKRNNAYHIDVRMFVRGESPSVRARTVTCDYCSEDKATDILATTVAQAYANEPSPAEVSPNSPPPPVVTPAPLPQPSDDGAATKKKALIGGAVALGAGGAVAIGLGAWKLTQNGEVQCDPICQQRNTTAGTVTAFVVGGVAIAGAITLGVLAARQHRATVVTMAGGN
jgi:hypothetical protein